MNFFKLISDQANKVAKFVVIISILGMSVVIFAQIFCRYFLNYSLFWSEEVARFLMIWGIFMGASVALKRGELSAVSFFVNSLSKMPHKIIILVGNIMIIFFLIIIITYGYQIVKESFSYLAPTLPIPMGIQYSSVLISSVIMFIHILYFTLEQIASFREMK